MIWKFGRIQPWTAELAALDQFKNLFLENYSKYFDDLLSGERSLPFGLLVDLIFFILAGNENNYKSLDEFEFGQNSAADFGVSCPYASEKTSYNLVSTLAPSFLIGSSSYLQVTRTAIISLTSSNFSQI